MQTEQQYLPQKKLQKTGLSVQAPSSSNNDTVATVVHQIMTQFNKAVSEEDRIMVITKTGTSLNATKWLLEVIAFNANSRWRQGYGLSQAHNRSSD
jgi:hypothetical protein